MNHEAWLMLIGLNIYFWTHSLVEKAVSGFCKLMVWEEDYSHMARVLALARVTDLQDIPGFFVFFDGDDFGSESWSVQCEILQTHMMGVALADEDQPDNPDVVQPHLFDLFWIWAASSWRLPPSESS